MSKWLASYDSKEAIQNICAVFTCCATSRNYCKIHWPQTKNPTLFKPHRLWNTSTWENQSKSLFLHCVSNLGLSSSSWKHWTKKMKLSNTFPTCFHTSVKSKNWRWYFHQTRWWQDASVTRILHQTNKTLGDHLEKWLKFSLGITKVEIMKS